MSYKLPDSKVLVLKTVGSDMKAYGGFQYPYSGHVIAEDFKPTVECSNGLHGFLWGVGNCIAVNWSEDANWLVLEVDSDGIVELDSKVKFEQGNVVFVGNRHDAIQFINKYAPNNSAILGMIFTGGDRSTLTGGDESTLTGGDWSIITGGDWSIITGGDYSTLTIKYHDGDRYRLETAYVGEDGIKANTPYMFDTYKKQWVERNN